MKIFKNHKGSLLLEAVFSTFIVGMVMGSVFMTVSNILKHLTTTQSRIERFFVAKEFLISSIFSKNESSESDQVIEKKNTEPLVNLIFTKNSISPESVFSKIKYLSLAQVKFGWEVLGIPRSEKISMIVFSLPEPKEKSKDGENG